MAAHIRPGSLASKAVHVKIFPTARTFAERREVLRVLARYGEVDVFRSLKVRLVFLSLLLVVLSLLVDFTK